MSKIKVVSLFSGIGGFETGLFQAFGKEQVEIVFASEIDSYASKAYQVLYGERPHGDITQIHATDIPDHDLLVGGFPCQAFSAAGKRLGFEDMRGTLFFDIARIAKEKQPKMMLLENVKGLLSHDKGRTFDVIAQTLADLGYVFDFALLNSKHFDVPQNRERVYIVAMRDVEKTPWDLTVVKGSVEKAKKRLQAQGIHHTFNFPFPTQTTVTKRLRSILEPHVEASYYLKQEKERAILTRIQGRENTEQTFRIDDKRGGNAIHSWELEVKGIVTEEEKEALNRMILERRKGEKDGNPIDPKQVGATTTMFDRLVTLGYLKNVGDRYDFNFGNLSYDVSKIIPPQGISPTITCTDAAKYGVLVQEDVGLQFVAGVTEQPNWLDNGKALSRNYKQGSRIYDANGIATTLSAQGVGGLGGHAGLYLVPEWRIRRLTPLECFRLQGFPDTYIHALQEAGMSNARLYKMAGNAVTTNVIRDLAHVAKTYL